MLRPRSMASLAARNPRQQDVTRLRARERFRMAVHTSESLMRPMIELRMRHPPKCCLCARDARQFNRDAGEFIGVTPPRGRQFDLSVESSCKRRERVALLAGVSPKQVVGLGGALRHPLRRSEDANGWRQRLTSQVATRIALYTHFSWVRGNVFTECSDQKCVYNFRFVVRHAFVESLVECEQMARGASIGEFHRRHQLPAAHRFGKSESVSSGMKSLIALVIADSRSEVLGISVGQVRTNGSPPLPLAPFVCNIA